MFLVAVLACGLAAVAGHAHAEVTDVLANPQGTALLLLLYTVLSFAFQLVMTVFIFLAQAFNTIIHLSVTTGRFEVLQRSWAIIRDFCNMLFIVVMIIIAFGTIFETFKFASGYDVRKLIGKFLVSAVLINFSMVIALWIMSGFNSLNSIMLNAIGDVSVRIEYALDPTVLLGGKEDSAYKDFSDKASQAAGWIGGMIGRIGCGAATGDILPGGAADPCAKMLSTLAKLSAYGALNADKITTLVVMRYFFATVLALMASFSLAVASFFALFRIPMLWILLIVSPLAWLANILPVTADFNKKWWKEFWGWNLYLPIFLLTLYFGLFFLGHEQQIVDQLTGGRGNINFSDPGVIGFSLQYVFFYILAGIILVVGTAGAKEVSKMGGTGAAKAYDWARNAAWRLPVFTQYRDYSEAVTQATRARMGQFEQKGLPGPLGQFIYGGREAQEERIKRFKGYAGVAGFEQEKVLAEKISSRKKELKDKETPLEDLRTKLSERGNVIERLAAAEELLARKELSVTQMKEILTEYRERSPIAAKAFNDRVVNALMDTAKERGFRNRDELADAISMINLKDKKSQLIDTAQKRNLAWAVELRQQLERSANESERLDPLRDGDGNQITTREGIIAQALSGMRPQDMRNVIMDRNSIADEEIRRLIAISLNRNTVQGMMKGGTPLQRRTVENFIIEVKNNPALSAEVQASRSSQSSPEYTGALDDLYPGGRRRNP